MFTFLVKKIQGKNYSYLQGKIQVARKKSFYKTISLGPATRPDSLKEAQFKQQLLELEVQERTAFWKDQLQHKDSFPAAVIKKAEGQRSLLNFKRFDLDLFKQRKLLALFVVDFVYNSNRIEGSRVPRATVSKIISEGKPIKNKEVINSVNAIEAAKSFPTAPLILNVIKLHKILLGHEPLKHGLRTEVVVVGNHETLHHSQIRKELSQLLKWYKKNRDKLYPLDLAFTFYYRFERIHPFIDGNGRMGRILMNAILEDHHYFPITIWDEQRNAHFSAFNAAVEGRTKKFFHFMTQQYKKTYQIYLKHLTSL